MVAIGALDDEHLWRRTKRKSQLCPNFWRHHFLRESDECFTHLGHTHLVGGEGAGLVGADDGGAAQGLHRGQASDDGVLLCHTAGTESQAGGDDGGQT